MCGICGYVGDPSGIDQERMSEALRHRGPDDAGTFRVDLADRGSVFLANRRLAILDPSPRGHQPMSTPDGRFVIVHNGEIYNFRQIAEELRAKGVRFRGASDTEVVLHAWQAWGPACLERFRGMFAFALYDCVENRLFLARDRLGEKPLYYWTNGASLLFASEVRSLLWSGIVPRKMDGEGLDAYLSFGSVADPFTLVEGVRNLEAGHLAEVVEGRLVSQPYWTLSGIDEMEEGVDAAEAAAETGALYRDACRIAMESDVPVGLLLSGGIDSSSNVAVLSELGFEDLRTFSVVFPQVDSLLNEGRWSSLVAERFGTNHQTLTVGLGEARNWVSEGVARMDQPSIDGINTYIVTRAIRDAGIKVAISGQGGDELFLGYPQRTHFSGLVRLATLPLPWPITRLSRKVSSMSSMVDTRYEKLLQLLPRSDRPVANAYISVHSVYSQAGIERLRGNPRPPQGRFIESQGGTTALGRLSRLELAYYLRNTLLRDADQMSMANSVELRQPFLDARLIERVVSLPVDVKVRRGRQKPLLVEAVGTRLPREIVERPKAGFVLPYDRWLREGLAVCDPLEVAVGLEREAIRGVQDRFAKGASWTRLWALQVLASWVERHGLSEPS
jgi:asparagine synthase (glutamine-hydrolysing)